MIALCMHINHKNIYYLQTQAMKDRVVKDIIEKTFKTHPSYGHRRLALELNMNKKKILRVMHEFNLKPPRAWYNKKFTTKSDPTYQANYTNLLKNTNMTECVIGQVWSSDLTYIKFQGRFLYLAIIQDIVSKEIVGFNISDKHNSELVLKTLKDATLKTKKVPQIFHSDRGREFLSEMCIRFLENVGVQISVSDPGSPWQNGWSESFFSRFKAESGNLNRFETEGELIEYIFGYISYYNNDRIQTTIKMTPHQFKQKFSESVLELLGT